MDKGRTIEHNKGIFQMDYPFLMRSSYAYTNGSTHQPLMTVIKKGALCQQVYRSQKNSIKRILYIKKIYDILFLIILILYNI